MTKELKAGLLWPVTCIVLLSTAFQNCSDDEPSTKGPVVYVAGFDSGTYGEQDGTRAICWKNGKATAFETSTNSDNTSFAANSIVGSGNDIYAAGFDRLPSTGYVAIYWKNEEVVQLSDNLSEANSITVSGTDVYVAGYERSSLDVATYWKNGDKTSLTNGTTNARAHAIAVSGSDVYVAGYERNSSNIKIAKYWKNKEEAVPLTSSISTTHAEAMSIVISGTDVYVAGYKTASNGRKIAMCWKNGDEVPLTDDTMQAEAYSITVSESGDVYVAGYVYDGSYNVATYWKNGDAVSLLNDDEPCDGIDQFDEEARSITVVGTDVYVAGQEYTCGNNAFAVYWKNGEKTRLTDGNYLANANSIFVK